MRWLDKKGEDLKDYKDLNDNEVLYMVQENDEYAKDILFKKYKPLIEKYAKKYLEHDKTCGLELSDYIQEGYYALFYAYKHYDIFHDNTFYTYLDLCIRSKMINLYNKHTTLGHKSLNSSISLNASISLDEDIELIDTIADAKGVSPVFELEKREIYEKLNKIFFKLPLEQSCILELYYNGFSQKDIARLLDINYRTVGQTLDRIRKKLIENKNY